MLALSSLAALAVISPFFFFGQASGHDFQFHVASWMEVARQWHGGIVYPRWAAGANFGFGEPRFIFYPPASWMLGAALGFFLPWSLVPGAFIFLCVVLSAFTMRKLSSGSVPAEPAIAAGLLYAVNPYQLLTLYQRSDFAELLANAVFPLALYYALRCAAPGPSRIEQRNAFPDWIRLALIYAFVWLSNAPAAVILSYALALFFLITALSDKSVEPLVRGAAAMLLGTALACFYIVPAAFERSWVNISEAIAPGFRPQDNFLFAHTSDLEHNLFNHKASEVALVVIALTIVIALWRFQSDRTSRRHLAPWIALSVAAIWLMTPLSSFAWRLAPELAFIQFSWRWLSVLTMCAAFLFGQAIAGSANPKPLKVGIASLLVATGLAILFGPMPRPWWNSDDLTSVEDQFRSGHGYEGVDEYYPAGGDRTTLPETGPLVVLSGAVGTASVRQWSAESKALAIDSPVPQTVALRLLNYPAWRVLLNGRQSHTDSSPQTGQMLIPVPAGTTRLEVRFENTADRKVGGWLSVAGLVIASLAILAARRKATVT